MAMNIKGHIDVRRYNPSRDIAYAWPNLMQAALVAFDKETDEPITGCLIETFNVSDTDIGELVGRYAKYFQACLNQGDKNFKNPEEALASTGFFELPPSHQAVILARMGQIITGAFFYAIKDVYVDTDEPPFNDAKIIEFGYKAKEAFINRSKPRWYHYLVKPWLLLKRK
jgi:hypothetical protein